MKSRSILAAFVLCIVFAASAVAVDTVTNEVSRAAQSTQPTFGLDRVGALQEAVAMLREIFQKHPLSHDFIVNWKDYGPHSLDIHIVYWCKTTDVRQFLRAIEEINLEIKRHFDAAKLGFAFPTQTVLLRQS